MDASSSANPSGATTTNRRAFHANARTSSRPRSRAPHHHRRCCYLCCHHPRRLHARWLRARAARRLYRCCCSSRRCRGSDGVGCLCPPAANRRPCWVGGMLHTVSRTAGGVRIQHTAAASTRTCHDGRWPRPPAAIADGCCPLPFPPPTDSARPQRPARRHNSSAARAGLTECVPASNAPVGGTCGGGIGGRLGGVRC